MKKTISLPLAIAIIVVCAGLAGWITVTYYLDMPEGEEKITEIKSAEEEEEEKLSEKEQACIDSVGTVTTAMCCESANDFPKDCYIGWFPSCDCQNKPKQIKICDCGDGNCFDGAKCVFPNNVKIETAGFTTLKNKGHGYEITYPSKFNLQEKGNEIKLFFPESDFKDTGLDLSYSGLYFTKHSSDERSYCSDPDYFDGAPDMREFTAPNGITFHVGGKGGCGEVGTEICCGFNTAYITIYKDNCYEMILITRICGEFETDLVKISEEILSTFKFLE